MKSYTDIEQSKKLAEILPLESADMYWMHVEREGFNDWWKVETIQGAFKPSSMDIPCWSLAALLSLLKRPTLHQTNDGKWYCDIIDNRTYFSKHYDNPVDALYEMILKLHEQKSK